jgi:hypothetical protein
MPRERGMFGPEGLLTHLRIAIVHNDISLAKDLAELCSFQNSINMRKFHRFIGRILLKHKFPEGKTLFRMVEERCSNPRATLKDETVKAKRFVEAAVAAAKLKTNHAPFEKAFVALFQACRKNPLILSPWEHFDSNATVRLYDEMYKARLPTNIENLRIDHEDHSRLRTVLFQTLDTDDFQTISDGKEPPTISFASFSDDHVLKQMWGEMLGNDSVGTSVYDSMNHFVPRSFKSEVESVLKENEVLKTRQNTLLGTNIANVVELVFPGCSGVFNTFMEVFIKENKLYFLTLQKSVLKTLRTECRLFYATLNNVTVEGVKYGCRYVKKMKSHWLMQLVLPLQISSPCKEKPVGEEFPLLGKMFELGFPKIMPLIPLDPWKPPEGCLFQVPTKTTVDFPLSGNRNQRWCLKEHFETKQLKWKVDLEKPEINLALLQLLVVRFYKNMATTYQDLRIRKEGSETKLVMLDGTPKAPNRKHPDVWHQLFHIDKNRKSSGVFRNKTPKNYYEGMIEALKDYLRGYGGLDQAFFQWGKNHYGEAFTHGLFPKMMTSLSAKNANGKRPAHALVEEDLGIATIRGQSQATV